MVSGEWLWSSDRLRQHAGDGGGGAAFADGVVAGDGDFQLGAGGLGGQGAGEPSGGVWKRWKE